MLTSVSGSVSGFLGDLLQVTSWPFVNHRMVWLQRDLNDHLFWHVSNERRRSDWILGKKKVTEWMFGISCSEGWWSCYHWKCPSDMWIWHLGIWFGGYYCHSGLTVLVHDLEDLFQSWLFCDLFAESSATEWAPSARPGCSKPQPILLTHFQGRNIHNFHVPLVPVPRHPHSNELLLTI